MWVRRADSSELVYVNGFYNMHYIIESLLNIAETRMGLYGRSVISVSMTSIDLNDVLDELAKNVAHSSKIFVSEARLYLGFAIRFAGMFVNELYLYKHPGHTNKIDIIANRLIREQVKTKYFSVFKDCKTYKKLKADGEAILDKWNLPLLKNLIQKLLSSSLLTDSKDDFTRGLSFLHSIMKIAGYGRSLRQASAPKVPDTPPVDVHGLADRIKSIVKALHHQAVNMGYHVVKPQEWKSVCATAWRSTSSGVSAEKVEVLMNGVKKKVSVKNKMSIGSLLGERMFTREMLSIKRTKQNPCGFGIRCVPYKGIRLIFVLPITTINAQIAVANHLVRVIGEPGVWKGIVDAPIDTSHIFTGSSSTTGVRISDNRETIVTSGTSDILVLDIDLKSFDQNSIGWNYRKPLMDSLKEIGRQYKNYKYGVDEITFEEMVDYAYGEGHVYKTYWDNGRSAFTYITLQDYNSLNDDWRSFVDERFFHFTVGPDIPGLSSYNAPKKVSANSKILKLHDGLTLTRDQKRELPVKVGSAHDGSDLILIECEASGELTTLLMNSAQNAGMQDIALREIQENTRLGKRLKAIKFSVIGDDCEIIFRILRGDDLEPEMIDEFLEYLVKLFSEMGHVLSVEKVYLTLASSELLTSQLLV